MADNKKPSSEENATENSNGPVWMVGGLVLILSLVAIGVGFFMNRSEEADQTAEIQVTASVSDSIVMPTAVPEGASSEDLVLAPLSNTGGEAATNEADDSANPPVTGEGESVQAANEQTTGQSGEQEDAPGNGSSDEQTENASLTSISASALTLGQTLVGQSANGSRIRLHLDAAPDAPVMHVYENGAPFILLESDIDDLVYPIQVGGQEWYRVRAADGLVGWISGGNIGLGSSPEPVPTIAG